MTPEDTPSVQEWKKAAFETVFENSDCLWKKLSGGLMQRLLKRKSQNHSHQRKG